MEEDQAKPTTHTEHTTPRDFALYAGAMIALYWSALQLGVLWFALIEIFFPDPLRPFNPSGGALRFALSSLLIVGPVALWLLRLIHRNVREGRMPRESRIQKWLVYLTLLIAGGAVAIDLVVLLNSYLAGELTVRFFLKALAVLVIAGSGFAYFWFEVKGWWLDRPRWARGASAGAALVLILSVAAGLWAGGSPGTQRALRLDQVRINDLQTIQFRVLEEWRVRGALPENLAALENDLTGFRVPRDPVTGETYTYEKTGERSFRLCATFDAESPFAPQGARFKTPGLAGSSWEHPAGFACFERTVDESLFPTKGMPMAIPAG